MKRDLLVLLAGGLATLAALAGIGHAASEAAPKNTGEPRIDGAPVVGRTLTATRGTWSRSPSSYDYQWVRCGKGGGRPDGSDCAAIAGATTRAYVVGGGDVNRRLRVRVTASNADGSATAASNATQLVTRAGSVTNTAPPTISGQPVVGATLTADNGTWAGENLTFSYSWRRCDADGAGCAAITGAGAKSYVAAQVDVGSTLRVRVVARNQDRSAGATSAATPRITVGAAGPKGCPAGSGRVDVSGVSPPARLSIDRQELVPPILGRDTGTVTARFRVSACGGRPVSGALVYVTAVPYNQFSVPAEQRTDGNGWATLTMSRLRGYPATSVQQLLVLFVRARKAGENPLGGISTRRLVSFPVRLNG